MTILWGLTALLLIVTLRAGIIGQIAAVAGVVQSVSSLFGGGDKPASRTLSPIRMNEYYAVEGERQKAAAWNVYILWGGGAAIAAIGVFLYVRR